MKEEWIEHIVWTIFCIEIGCESCEWHPSWYHTIVTVTSVKNKNSDYQIIMNNISVITWKLKVGDEMFHNLIENKWFILAPLTAILAVSLIIVSMRYKYIYLFSVMQIASFQFQHTFI